MYTQHSAFCVQFVTSSLLCVFTSGFLDGFLKAYIAKYRYSTVTTEEWKEFFLDFFNKEVCALV